MGNNVTVNDNTKEVLAALEKALERGLEAAGMTAERYAKKNETAVDTGLLRNSITFALSGEKANISSYSSDDGTESGVYSGTAPNDKDKAVYIGTNVEYGPYIELGARGTAGIHFLKKAATEHKAEYRKLIQDSLKNA